jgi:hypothetical protein
MSQFWQRLFSENTNASKRDMPHPIRAPVAPLKTAKAFFRKHECLKKGHAAPDPGAGCTPENGKSFFPKTRNPIFGTVLNDNPMITLR